MHFIFGTILFLVWVVFWIRGNIWAAVVGAAPAVILMWFDFVDTTDPKFWSHPLQHLDTNPVNWIFMLGWFCAAFIPWYIQRHRRLRMERALYGIRFADVDEPPPKRERPTEPPIIYSKGESILASVFLGCIFIGAAFNILKGITGRDPTPLIGNAILTALFLFGARYIIRRFKEWRERKRLPYLPPRRD